MNKGSGEKSIFKTVFSVSSILLFAKIFGFVKQIIVANAFGATIDTDIISLSQGIVTNFEYLISQTMITAFIPIYISVKETKQNEKHFASNVIKIFVLISVFISAFIFLFAPFISRILAPSYKGAVADSLTYNIRIYAFCFVVLVLTAIFNALLKGNKRFLPGEITSVNQSLVFIICVLMLGNVFGVQVLIISFFLYAVINMIYLGFLSRKLYKVEVHRFQIDENVKKLLRMIAPLLFGYAMLYINQLVDKMLASGLSDGTVTAMSYSAVLSNFITGFIGSICGIAFTYIAQNVAEKSDEKAAVIVGYFITFFVTFLVPVSVISVSNAKEIVTIVYGRGAFDAAAIENSTYALMGYGSLFIPYVLRELFTRFQYSYQDSKRPMLNSAVSIVCNIVLSIVFSRFWGILGITIASSISVFICAVLNIASSRKFNCYLKISFFSKQFIFWIAGGVFCLLVNILLKRYLPINNILLRFLVLSAVSFIVYMLAVLPLIVSVIRKYKLIKK